MLSTKPLPWNSGLTTSRKTTSEQRRRSSETNANVTRHAAAQPLTSAAAKRTSVGCGRERGERRTEISRCDQSDAPSMIAEAQARLSVKCNAASLPSASSSRCGARRKLIKRPRPRPRHSARLFAVRRLQQLTEMPV